MKKLLFLFIALTITLFSCATLQEDIYISSEDNQYIYSSIEYYENSYIQIDSAKALGQDVSSDVKNLLSQLNAYINSTNLAEPVLIARLTALKGLLLAMNKNRGEALKCYNEAKSLQSSDRYVHVLAMNLEKSLQDKMNYADNYLKSDAENPLMLLEKSKLLLSSGDYKNAVALMDDAFVIFSKENLEVYNEVYSQLREYAWNLYTISSDSEQKLDNINLNEKVDLNLMVNLTLKNTSLLDNYKSSSNVQTKKMIEILTAEHYFNSPLDYYGSNGSFEELLQSEYITRRYCARFFWNIFVKNEGNQALLTKYSERYKKSSRTKSPIDDIRLENPDFDAILGVVENEIMELPDGKNFLPDESISVMDYLKWVKKIEN